VAIWSGSPSSAVSRRYFVGAPTAINLCRKRSFGLRACPGDRLQFQSAGKRLGNTRMSRARRICRYRCGPIDQNFRRSSFSPRQSFAVGARARKGAGILGGRWTRTLSRRIESRLGGFPRSVGDDNPRARWMGSLRNPAKLAFPAKITVDLNCTRRMGRKRKAGPRLRFGMTVFCWGGK